jgi:phospholipase/carboxylesterase
MMPILDGPRIAPRAGGPARSLVVLLHGYGADGQDLIDLGAAWSERLPDTAFVAPDAPEPCEQAPAGRQWFALTTRSAEQRWNGVNAAAPVLQAFLDAELQRHKLAAAGLALVGFSQGCMMALHVGLRRSSAPAGIVGYSGTLVTPPGAAPEAMAGEITSRPPVLLMHGNIDDVIPVAALRHAADGLAALSVPVEQQMVPALGHAINAQEIRRGGEFLAHRLAAAGIGA